jgi:fructoselysine transporter
MSNTASEIPAPTLNRVLGPTGVMMLTFSALSPVSGVYLGGDAVLHLAGSGAAIAFIVGGIISFLLALLHAELGAAFPRAGGIYPGIGAVLGAHLAFPFLILAVPGAFAFVAFTALGLADYVRVLFPGLPLETMAVAAIALGAAIAALNVRLGAMVTGAFLAVEVAALALLTGVALLHPVRPLFELIAHPVMLDQGILKPVSFFTLGLATVSGVWATGGANWAMYFGEEMHEAERRIGRVIAWVGLFAALSIATPVVLLLMSAQDLPEIFNAEAPVAAYLAKAGGPTITALVSAGVIAALFNNVIASCMVFGRLLYSTGRDRIWWAPVNRLLSYLQPRLRSPVIATLIVGAVAALATLLGERYLLIFLSGDVSAYGLISLAILHGRPRGATGRHFRAPLFPALPLFCVIFTGLAVAADWMDPDAGRPSTILLSSLFALALVYYFVRLRDRPASWLGGADAQEAVRRAGDAG